MNVVIKEGEVFRKLISCLKDLITDSGELIFNENGVYMQSIDTNKVVMIDLELNQDAFEKYELDSEEIKLGLNFVNFSDILKLSKSTHINLIYKKESDKLTVKINENRKKIQFNMNLSTTNKEELELFDINYDVKIYIELSEFQKSIKDLSSFGKKCRMIVKDNDFTLSVTGDAGEGDICVSDAEIEYSQASNEGEEYGGIFDVKYLNLFTKAALIDEIILKFGKDVPFCFEYQFEYGYIRFYLSQMTD